MKLSNHLRRLLPVAAAGIALSGALQASTLTIQLNKPSYLPFEHFVLDVAGPAGSVVITALDTDPGPTVIPGIGSLDLGFSGNFFFFKPVVLVDGTYQYTCTIPCTHPLFSIPLNVQAVGYFPPSFMISNTETLMYADTYGFCGTCGPCDGKIDALLLQYLGASSAFIEVKQKTGGQTVFSGTVAPGGTFSFFGVDQQNTLSPEIEIYVDGVLETMIHTSCSQDIYLGMVVDDFKILAGSSRNGGPICPPAPEK